MGQFICSLEDLKEGESKGFTIDSNPYFIVRKYGELYAYHNSCPHLGIQLEMIPDQFLDTSNSLINCSMHGALFRIEDGLCVSGPCAEQFLTSIPIMIEDGNIYMIVE
ncbi:Rieske (2Fe-2S) protein [Bermanella marisrubri]|uniref:Rieske (2Fe-2S) region protein n=1 Tax=Bermanella marisrubri TaxID=207949 RepID=Q1N0I4_9GAMM|nr:Rieske (2Fe-2S) protein [Bermanella marisrubri]EAT11680.1 Rieske (2Fe-2S) region protein [Oceanobacter sp. RED65] [Bermanella marisrubri]QIZ83284.1 Rieske (2Fe-2S) protein [Bermanella marisrubri]